MTLIKNKEISKVEVKFHSNRILKVKIFPIFPKKKFLIKKNIKEEKLLCIFLKVLKQQKVRCRKKLKLRSVIIVMRDQLQTAQKATKKKIKTSTQI